MPQPYEDVLEYDQPWEAVFEAAQRAVRRLPKMVLLVADPTTGRIAVMQGITLRSFGATILIDVGHVSAGQTRVRVWSHIAGLHDLMNKNRSNVNEILVAIDEELTGARS